MRYETADIRNSSSEDYAKLEIYSLDATDEIPGSDIRPMVIICPGGGYCFTSKREGEPIAMKFLAEGIHAAVLWYSIDPAVFPTAVTEVAASVNYIRTHAEELHVDPEKIYVIGFSAGGHLAASYGCFWNCGFLRDALGLSASDAERLRPTGMILCYPVITSGPKAHEDSFVRLTGSDDRSINSPAAAEIISRSSAPGLADMKKGTPVTREALWKALSLEYQVSADTPDTFIWHTRPDDCVPVENTLLFVNALNEHGIGYEVHIYPAGGHGLSLANEITKSGSGETVPAVTAWIGDVCRWLKDR